MGSWLRSLFRPLRTVALVDLGIFVLAGAVCWLLGWRTLGGYGNSLIICGALVMAVGLMSALGGRQSGISYTRMAAESLGSGGLDGYAKRAHHDLASAYSFMFLATAVGVAPIAIGLLLQAAFP